MAKFWKRRIYMGADKLRHGVDWRRKAKAMQSVVKSSSGKAETRYAAAKQCEALERQRGATEKQS